MISTFSYFSITLKDPSCRNRWCHHCVIFLHFLHRLPHVLIIKKNANPPRIAALSFAIRRNGGRRYFCSPLIRFPPPLIAIPSMTAVGRPLTYHPPLSIRSPLAHPIFRTRFSPIFTPSPPLIRALSHSWNIAPSIWLKFGHVKRGETSCLF